ncbi:MAG: hypothetical protein Q6363_001985 [Candidatus Njordarchaeota archaeon]
MDKNKILDEVKKLSEKCFRWLEEEGIMGSPVRYGSLSWSLVLEDLKKRFDIGVSLDEVRSKMIGNDLAFVDDALEWWNSSDKRDYHNSFMDFFWAESVGEDWPIAYAIDFKNGMRGYAVFVAFEALGGPNFSVEFLMPIIPEIRNGAIHIDVDTEEMYIDMADVLWQMFKPRGFHAGYYLSMGAIEMYAKYQEAQQILQGLFSQKEAKEQLLKEIIEHLT